MRAALVAAMLLLLALSAWAADMMYVTPRTELPLRSGKGTEYRIVAVLTEGEQVKFLREEDNWAEVETASGKRGWVLRRYIDSTPPPSIRLTRLREECDGLRSQYETLISQQQETMSRLDSCQASLDSCIDSREKVKQEYAALKQDAADIFKLKSRLEEAEKELRELKRDFVTVKKENAMLKNGQRIKWFMAGAAVLLAGWIIGMVTGRGRKRRSTLL